MSNSNDEKDRYDKIYKETKEELEKELGKEGEEDYSSIFKTFLKDSETYSLKVITDWLKHKNISYKYASSPIDRVCMYQHGIRVSFPTFELSIQTHPAIAGPAFVETLRMDNMLSDTRHATPEIFFEFLNELLTTEVVDN